MINALYAFAAVALTALTRAATALLDRADAMPCRFANQTDDDQDPT